MDNALRCQSCGMPLADGFYGTNNDDSINMRYCKFCFLGGEFTHPNQTLEEMIASSIDNLENDVGIPHDDAVTLANTYIPNLRRWRAN